MVWDKNHALSFGLIGLHRAPLKQATRDEALGITKEGRDWWVNMSLSAQRIGALPPYNEILGSKLIVMALTCNEVRSAYRQRYQGRTSSYAGASCRRTCSLRRSSAGMALAPSSID
ncbi:MAG: DUF4338 domain-containing protein [Chloroflexi bacterium]|nr:DUF4338 domain-containing protein [Chloroflexota bacterium]